MEENVDKNNMIWQKFGRVLVLKVADEQTCKNVRFTCLCECGQIFDTQGNHLRSGRTKSCGHCKGVTLSDNELDHIAKDYLDTHPPIRQYHLQKISNNNIPYHPYRKRIKSIWKNMKQRCYNQSQKNYMYYGARGIKVCNEWHDFKSFFDWSIAHGYCDGLTLDRINNDEDYEPSNCRWVDYFEQAKNRRPSKRRSGVVQLAEDGELIAEYKSISEAQKAINASSNSGIYQCINGKQCHAFGYKWARKEDYIQKGND